MSANKKWVALLLPVSAMYSALFLFSCSSIVSTTVVEHGIPGSRSAVLIESVDGDGKEPLEIRRPTEIAQTAS